MRYMNANITVLNRLRVSLVFFFLGGGGRSGWHIFPLSGYVGNYLWPTFGGWVLNPLNF